MEEAEDTIDAWQNGMIMSLNRDVGGDVRWQQAVDLWDIAIAKTPLRTAIAKEHGWVMPDVHDPITGTLRERYTTSFILNRMSEALGVSRDEWFKQPRFLCDRDITIVQKTHEIRSKIPTDIDPDLLK